MIPQEQAWKVNAGRESSWSIVGSPGLIPSTEKQKKPNPAIGVHFGGGLLLFLLFSSPRLGLKPFYFLILYFMPRLWVIESPERISRGL